MDFFYNGMLYHVSSPNTSVFYVNCLHILTTCEIMCNVVKYACDLKMHEIKSMLFKQFKYCMWKYDGTTCSFFVIQFSLFHNVAYFCCFVYRNDCYVSLNINMQAYKETRVFNLILTKTLKKTGLTITELLLICISILLKVDSKVVQLCNEPFHFSYNVDH